MPGNLGIPDGDLRVTAEVDTFLTTKWSRDRSLDPEFLDWVDVVTITPSLQLATNRSVIQIATMNFPLVVSSIFSFQG